MMFRGYHTTLILFMIIDLVISSHYFNLDTAHWMYCFVLFFITFFSFVLDLRLNGKLYLFAGHIYTTALKGENAYVCLFI